MDGANSKVYREQGGDTLVVANGGKITVEAGGEIDVSAGTFTGGTARWKTER